MKYTTTQNKTYRIGIGEIPKPWIQAHLTDHKEIVELHFYRHIKLWDFDICGDQTHDFVFDDGKAFRLEYSWWRDDWADEDECCLKHEFYIEEITIEEANVLEKKMERDWI
jgi:hypothetical protein